MVWHGMVWYGMAWHGMELHLAYYFLSQFLIRFLQTLRTWHAHNPHQLTQATLHTLTHHQGHDGVTAESCYTLTFLTGWEYGMCVGVVYLG